MHVMVDGRIVASGDAALALELERTGYAAYAGVGTAAGCPQPEAPAWYRKPPWRTVVHRTTGQPLLSKCPCQGRQRGRTGVPRSTGAGRSPVRSAWRTRRGCSRWASRIDRSSGRGRKTKQTGKSGKPRRTTGQRVLRVAIVAGRLHRARRRLAGTATSATSWGQDQDGRLPSCAAVASGAPYNVLVIGSDTRVGETAAEAQEFGNSDQRRWPAQRHHQDHPRRPQGRHGQRPVLPRDTFVTLSGRAGVVGRVQPEQVELRLRHRPERPGPERHRGQRAGARPSRTPSASPSITGSWSTSSA